MGNTIISKIPLTQGKFAIVDTEDYEKLAQYRWCANKARNDRYYVCRSTYPKGGKGKLVRVIMHRVIMGVTDSKVFVDHINGDTLDNRKANLRLCTHAENMHNQNQKRRNFRGDKPSSMYKGVYRYESENRRKVWYASITAYNKRVSLGRYLTEVEAAKAYNEGATKYFGEFASLNNISEY